VAVQVLQEANAKMPLDKPGCKTGNSLEECKQHQAEEISDCQADLTLGRRGAGKEDWAGELRTSMPPQASLRESSGWEESCLMLKVLKVRSCSTL
jgi:hypothetical protein